MTKQTPTRFKRTENVWITQSELTHVRIAFALLLIALIVLIGALIGIYLIGREC
jgi:hypothetical protein